MFGPRCRFIPTCSQYMLEAVQDHGHIKGICLGTIRVCKCNPFNAGGYDPVPENHLSINTLENKKN